MMTPKILIFLLGAAFCAGCKPTPRTAGHNDAAENVRKEPALLSDAREPSPLPSPDASLVSVKVVSQGYNQIIPWEKEDPATRKLCGIYLGDGRILIPDADLRSANVVEVSLPDGSRTIAGRVVKVDSDAGLGIIEPLREEDLSFFEKSVPLALGFPLKTGDTAEVWDTARGGIPLVTPVAVESGGESAAFLPQVKVKVGQVLSEGAPGLPLVKDGGLVGIAESYSAEAQLLFSPDQEVLRRFIEGPEEDSPGVPVLGASMEQLIDPAFRAYLNLREEDGGVYISKVEPRSAAEAAGLKKGDVLVSVDGVPIDARGLCRHPRLGPLSWVALLRGAHALGDSAELEILRQGERRILSVSLNRDALEKSLIGRDKPGEQPRYIMYGGLLFQAVTADYLEAFKNRAKTGVPYEYLAIERNKEEYLKEGRQELVALALVIPTPATLGYDRMAACVLDAINGQPVRSLEEAAELLEAPTPSGLTVLSVNKPPYIISLDRELVKASNDYLLQRSLPTLRRLKSAVEGEKAGPREKESEI